MYELGALKEQFVELFPVDPNCREERFKIAGYKCELCGATGKLEQHHVIEGKNRRTFFERIFTTRIVCPDCHKWGKKHKMIRKFRIEVEIFLLQYFEAGAVLCIMGRTKLLSMGDANGN